MTRRGQGEQFSVQVQAAAEHRRRLQRLVRRPRQERDIGLADADDLAAVGGQPGHRTASATTGFASRMIVMHAVSYTAATCRTGYPAVLCERWCSGSARPA